MTGQTWPTANECWGVVRAKFHKELGLSPMRTTHRLFYYIESGNTPYSVVARFDWIDDSNQRRKELRVFSMNPSSKEWYIGGFNKEGRKYLPFGVHRLAPLVEKAGYLQFHEGEKCADCATLLGYPATCHPFGVDGINSTDFGALRNIITPTTLLVISRDNDSSGEKWATRLAQHLRSLFPMNPIKIVTLTPEIPKGDIFDLWTGVLNRIQSEEPTPSREQNWEDEAKKTAIMEIDERVEQATFWDDISPESGPVVPPILPNDPTPSTVVIRECLDPIPKETSLDTKGETLPPVSKTTLEKIPFPFHVFPKPIAEFISMQSRSGSKRIDPAAYGLAFLASMTAAVGRSRVLAIETGSFVPASLWCAILGYPTSGKSKPIKEVTEFIQPFMEKLRKEDNEKQKQYTRELRQWNKSDEGEEPEKPTTRVFYVQDPTPDALLKSVIAYPDRTLFFKDELTDLQRNHNGSRIVDPRFLSLWGGGGVGRTRVSEGDSGTRSSAVSVIGGVTMAKIGQLFQGENEGNGFASRFVKWQVHTYDHETKPTQRAKPNDPLDQNLCRLKVEITALFDFVLNKPIPMGSDGEPDTEKLKVFLSDEAFDVWEDWKRNQFDAKVNDLPESSALRWDFDRLLQAVKVILLVFHLFEQAEEDTHDDTAQIKPKTVRRVIVLANALMHECERLQQPSPTLTNEQFKVLRYLRKKHEKEKTPIAANVVRRGTGNVDTEKLLIELVKLGQVNSEIVKPSRGASYLGYTPTAKNAGLDNELPIEEDTT